MAVNVLDLAVRSRCSNSALLGRRRNQRSISSFLFFFWLLLSLYFSPFSCIHHPLLPFLLRLLLFLILLDSKSRNLEILLHLLPFLILFITAFYFFFSCPLSYPPFSTSCSSHYCSFCPLPSSFSFLPLPPSSCLLLLFFLLSFLLSILVFIITFFILTIPLSS